MKKALIVAMLTMFAAACSSTGHEEHGSGEMKDMKMDKPMSSEAPAATEEKKEAPKEGGSM